VKSILRDKLDSLAVRLEELNRLLAAEDATRNLDQFRKLSREHAELTGLVGLYDRYRQAERDAREAKDLAADAAMKGYAEDELKNARAAMEKLAKAYTPKQLAVEAYGLYEKFRPEIPGGMKGWGVKGELDLDYIRALAE